MMYSETKIILNRIRRWRTSRFEMPRIFAVLKGTKKHSARQEPREKIAGGSISATIIEKRVNVPTCRTSVVIATIEI